MAGCTARRSISLHFRCDRFRAGRDLLPVIAVVGPNRLRGPFKESSFFAVGHGATRDLLGTFRRKLSAFLAKLALPLPLPPGSNYGFWTQLSPTNLRSQKLFSFRALEKVVGIEPTTYSLGRSLAWILFLSSFDRVACVSIVRTAWDILGISCGGRAQHSSMHPRRSAFLELLKTHALSLQRLASIDQVRRHTRTRTERADVADVS